MSKTQNIRNLWIIFYRMVKYNLKIIFANRFVWFLLSAFAIFIFLAVQRVLNQNAFSEGAIYELLIFPGILLIFYPSAFGIQNDDDSRILEILFGIPNYRYKVWLVRLIMIYFLVYFIILLFSVFASVLLVNVNIFEMAYQLMYPIVFMGSMAFMFSTIIRNGNGTAVVMVLIGVMLLMLSGGGGDNNFNRSQWNVFLNPLRIPENMNQIIWQGVIFKNRMFLGVGILIFILYGLFNLQKREKFV